MGAVVVRCPACRGASQVGPDTVGLLVACPRCNEPFLAVEEAAPAPTPSTPGPLAPGSTDRTRPIRPRPTPRDTARRSRGWAEPIAPPDSPLAVSGPDHHLHSDLAPGGLPLSVMIGFALLPFAIPLVWLAALLLVGQPALSIATPVSLAISGSVLCLAVVFTVDWSPATRLKGVLMLVGLAYFAGFSLFFLKKDMIDWAKRGLSPQRTWKVFVEPVGGSYQVKLPAPHPRTPMQREDPLPGWKLTCYMGVHKGFIQPTTFMVASGEDSQVQADRETWFEAVEQALERRTRGTVTDSQTLTILQRHPGRQWRIEIPERDSVRVVRVYRVDGKIYFLSVEGPEVDPEDEDDLAYTFFNSFEIMTK